MAIMIPDVAPEPIPGVRLQPEANTTTFGGGPGLAQEGQEIQKIGASVGEIGGLEAIRAQKIAQFEQQKADETAVQEATAKLTAVQTDLLTNPQTGMPAYQGKNAMAGQTEVIDKYQKAANDIHGTLNGQVQQEAFNRIALEKGDQLLQQTHAHVASQMEKFADQTHEALQQNLAENSAALHGNMNAVDSNYLAAQKAATAYADHKGLDDPQTEKLMRQVRTNFNETVLTAMINDPKAYDRAKDYFSDHKMEMDTDSRDRVQRLFETVPKQQEEAAKSNQEQYFKANERQAMLDNFDGKMTLSEAQRLFRENKISEPFYNQMAAKLSKPDAFIKDPLTSSDPATFNQIRQAQLTGSKDPGEIQRMIMSASAAKQIGPEDGKYLLSLEKNQPPTPHDKQVEANANYLRDIGKRYFTSTNIFGVQTDDLKKKASDEAEAMVQDFYTQADKTKAQGEDLEKLRDQVRDTYARKQFPGLPPGEMPSIAIGIKGQVTQLLNPDEHSQRKADWTITRAQMKKKESQ